MDRQDFSSNRQKRQILFIGHTHASWARMAEGFTRALYPNTAFEVKNVAFRNYVHPLAILVMLQVGIDINALKTDSLSEWQDWENWEIIYPDLDRKDCPEILQNKQFIFWQLDSPDTFDLHGFEQIRDRIEIYVQLFLSST